MTRKLSAVCSNVLFVVLSLTLTHTHVHKNPDFITNQDRHKNSVKYQNGVTDTNSLEHTDSNPDAYSDAHTDIDADQNGYANVVADNHGYPVTPGPSATQCVGKPPSGIAGRGFLQAAAWRPQQSRFRRCTRCRLPVQRHAKLRHVV